MRISDWSSDVCSSDLADDPFATVGLQPVDTHVVAGQAVPDRQQEPGDDVELARRERRNLDHLLLPEAREADVLRRLPARGRVIADAHGLPAHRTNQTHALFDAAVVVHAAGRGDAHGGAVRDGVDDQRAVVPERDPVGFVQAERTIAVLAPDAIAAGLGAGGGRSEEHTSELQSLMRISYAVFCLKKNKKEQERNNKNHNTHNELTS